MGDELIFPLKSLSIKLIEMEPWKGAKLEDCKREAALIALFREVDVQFTYNGVEYIIGCEVLMEQVKELK